MSITTAKTAGFLENLPLELLLEVAKYLTPDCIKALRLVNKYLNSVFDRDLYWKQLLYYPEKYYMCDLRSQSRVPGVKEVLEEISENKLSRWKGFAKLQNAHLQTWKSGRVQDYDSIPISSWNNLVEIIDEHNERWLFFCDYDLNINIWNITAKPKAFKPLNIGDYSSMRILPQNNILVYSIDDWRKFGLLSVYNFQSSSATLSLLYEFVFDMDSIFSDVGIIPPHQSTPHHEYILTRDIVVCYKSRMDAHEEFYLHIWNLSSRKKLAKVNIHAFDAVRDFLDLVRTERDLTSDVRCGVNVKKGEFPNILIILEHDKPRRDVISQVMVFTLKEMRLVRVLHPMYNKVKNCSLYCGRVCVQQYKQYGPEKTCVSIFNVKPASDDEQRGRITVNACPATTDFQSHTKVLFKKSKVFIMTDNKMHVIRLNTTPLHHSSFKVKHGLSILGFIEPTLLLMCNKTTHDISKVIVYCTTTGECLYKWNHLEIDFYTNYFNNLKYPSKLLLLGKDESNVKLYNF